MSGFTALVTKDQRILVTRDGRSLAALSGARAEHLARALSRAADEDARQLLLARATGNDERGNER